MKALVKSKKEVGLWMEEVPKPTCGIDDVLIRVHRGGICGTDVHIWNWDDWAQGAVPVPTIVGHEFAGMWQGVIDVVREVADVAIPIDINVSNWPSPSDIAD